MMSSEHYGKKSYRFVDFLLIEVENIELLRIAGENEYGLLCNSDNLPIMPGTSIAGAVQAYLEEKKKKYYRTFWGNERFDNKVYFFDSLILNENEDVMTLIEERTGHKHDKEYGGAEDKKLYTERFLKRGGKFRIVVKVFSMEDEKNQVADFFRNLLNGIEDGEILFGSRKNNGCGQFKVHNAYQAKFDFTEKDDLMRYYLFEIDNKNEKKYTFLQNWRREENSEKKIKFTLEAQIKDALLIQGEITKTEGSDYQTIQSMKSDDKYIIPASTVKGILRGYCDKICKTCDWQFRDELIKKMFGTMEDVAGDSKVLRRGIIRVRDVVVRNEENLEYTRIKIDPFTGGTVNGAKMTSNPLTGGDVSFEVELYPDYSGNQLEDKEIQRAVALIFLTLRDLGQEKISIGSFSSVGFGRMYGDKITISVPEVSYRNTIGEDAKEGLQGEITLGKDIGFSGGVREYLEKCLRALTEEEEKYE